MKPVDDSCEHCNEQYNSIKYAKSLHRLANISSQKFYSIDLGVYRDELVFMNEKRYLSGVNYLTQNVPIICEIRI